MRLLAFVLCAAGLLSAQISEVSATASGDQVFFTTWLRPADSDHFPWEEAYQWSELGVSLVSQLERPGAPGWQIERVSPNADGSVLGISRNQPCTFGTPCISVLQEFSEIVTPAGLRVFEGHVQISPNGRFALLTRQSGFGVFPDEELRRKGLQRVRTNQLEAEPEPLGSLPGRRGRWIANDGTVLAVPVGDVAEWVLIPVEGDPVSFGLPEQPAAIVFLLADASAVVYQVFEPGARPGFGELDPPGELRVRSRNRLESSLAVSGSLEDVSDDGSTVVYTRIVDGARQAFVLDVPSGASRQVTGEPGGVESLDLTGDGSTLIAVSGGRILRFDLPSDQVESLLGPLPDFERGFADALDNGFIKMDRRVPGSTYRLFGDGIGGRTMVSDYPAGPALDGIRVTVEGVPAAVLWTSPYELGYQLAWDTPLSEDSMLVVSHERSGWEAPFVTRGIVERWAESALPMIETGPPEHDFYWMAIHQEFDRLVTAADPALTGEYIHLYVRGLGATTPAVETGHPSPSDRLAEIASPCTWTELGGPADRPAEVVFAGLAPGLVGYYQVVWKMPNDFTGNRIGLRCDPGGGFLGRYPIKPAD